MVERYRCFLKIGSDYSGLSDNFMEIKEKTSKMRPTRPSEGTYMSATVNYYIPAKAYRIKELDYTRSASGGIYISFLILSVWLPYYLSALVLAGLTVYALTSPDRRAFVIDGGPFGRFIWGIPAVSFLSSVINENLLGILISVGIFLIFAAGLYTYALMTRSRFEKSCDLMCIGSNVAAAIAVIQTFVINGDKVSYRPMAFALHPNYYGMLAMFSILIAFSRMRRGGSKRIYIITIIMNTFGIFLSESRSALAGAAACFIVYLIVNKKYKIAGAVLLCGVGVLSWCWGNDDSFVWRNSFQFVVEQRYDIWMGALRLYLSDLSSVLIGKGPMAYYAQWRSVGGPMADHAHSIYIDSLVNFGIIGTALIGILAWKMVRASMIKNDTGHSRVVKLLNLLMLVQIAVGGIVDNTIFWVHTAVCFAFVNSGLTTADRSANKM